MINGPHKRRPLSKTGISLHIIVFYNREIALLALDWSGIFQSWLSLILAFFQPQALQVDITVISCLILIRVLFQEYGVYLE